MTERLDSKKCGGPPINLVKDLQPFGGVMCNFEVLFNEVVLECSLDDLVEEVWG